MKVTERLHRLPRDVGESPSLEIVALGNWVQVALLEQWAWTRQSPDIPSNLNYSVIVMYVPVRTQTFTSNVELTVKSSYVR